MSYYSPPSFVPRLPSPHGHPPPHQQQPQQPSFIPNPHLHVHSHSRSHSNSAHSSLSSSSSFFLPRSSSSASSPSNSYAIPPPSGSEAAHQQAESLLKEAHDLERQLKAIQRTSGAVGSSAEKQVFALRKTIRHHYRQVIYLDLAFAAANDVEQNLWKYVFYKQIEELRKLLKQYAPHHSAGRSKGDADRYGRLATFFRQFLRDSKKFYRSLLNYHLKVAKIHRVGSQFRDLLDPRARRARQQEEAQSSDDEYEEDESACPCEGDGQPGDNDDDGALGSSVPSLSDDSSIGWVGPASLSHEELHLMYLALMTCHRSLIFLGDLERYSQLILGQPSSSSSLSSKDSSSQDKDWSKAERYYRWALTIMPTNGNPHNQLAVIASSRNNNFTAITRYFRSIAVAQPFATAAQNVKLLFQRLKNPSLFAAHQPHHQQQQQQQHIGSGACFTLCNYFDSNISSIRSLDPLVVQLLDTLYSNIQPQLEAALCLAHTIVSKLEQYLYAAMIHEINQPSKFASPSSEFAFSVSQSNSYCIHFMTNLLFCYHQLANEAPPSSPASFFHLSSLSLTSVTLFDYARCLIGSVHSKSLHKLASIGIFIDWLRSHTDIIDIAPTAGDVITIDASAEPRPASFSDLHQLVRWRFWRALAYLFNFCLDLLSGCSSLPPHYYAPIDVYSLREEAECVGFTGLSAAFPHFHYDCLYRRTAGPQSACESAKSASYQLSDLPADQSDLLSFLHSTVLFPSPAPASAAPPPFDRKTFRRLIKIFHFAHFLTSRQPALIRFDATHRRFFHDKSTQIPQIAAIRLPDPQRPLSQLSQHAQPFTTAFTNTRTHAQQQRPQPQSAPAFGTNGQSRSWPRNQSHQGQWKAQAGGHGGASFEHGNQAGAYDSRFAHYGGAPSGLAARPGLFQQQQGGHAFLEDHFNQLGLSSGAVDESLSLKRVIVNDSYIAHEAAEELSPPPRSWTPFLSGTGSNSFKAFINTASVGGQQARAFRVNEQFDQTQEAQPFAASHSHRFYTPFQATASPFSGGFTADDSFALNHSIRSSTPASSVGSLGWSGHSNQSAVAASSVSAAVMDAYQKGHQQPQPPSQSQSLSQSQSQSQSHLSSRVSANPLVFDSSHESSFLHHDDNDLAADIQELEHYHSPVLGPAKAPAIAQGEHEPLTLSGLHQEIPSSTPFASYALFDRGGLDS